MIEVKRELSIPVEANKKYADLSFSEQKRGDWRIIGGNFGDLYFQGFTVEDGKTILYKPHLKLFNPEESPTDEDFIFEYAQAILMDSFESIGAETVEHS